MRAFPVRNGSRTALIRSLLEYVYRYNADEDKISAWFVKEETKQLDGEEEVDYLFHDIETENGGQGWVGRGEHLCELDMYWAYERLSPTWKDGADDAKLLRI